MTTSAGGQTRAEITVSVGERVASLLDEIVRSVDAGELAATSPERAYLVGAAASARRLAPS